MRLVGILLMLGACSDELPATQDSDGWDTDAIVVDVTFEEHILGKLTACTGCHQGEAPDGGFDLSGGGMYERIVEVPSAQAESLNLIEPGSADYSYLWHKVNGTQSLAGGAGTRMPLGERWSDEDIELLALWIDLGALP